MAEKRVRRSSSIIQDVELEVLKENLRNKHKQIVEEVDEKIDRIFEEFFCEVNKLSLNRFDVERLFSDSKSGAKAKPKKQSKRITKNQHSNKNNLPDRLPEKQFQPRNSLLTDLFEIKHVNTIYHVFIVIFNLLLLNVFVSDFVDTGRINIGLDPIGTGFRGLHYAVFIWCWMQLTVFALFPVFAVWAGVTRKYFSRRGLATGVWHTFGVFSVVAFIFGFIGVYTRAVVHFDLGQASSVAVLMELVRFVMKAYAFIRTNVPRALRLGRKPKSSNEENSSSDDASYDHKTPFSGSHRVNEKRPLPNFRQYAYFLFAPTLIYRDEYPRTRHIRWNFVVKCFGEVATVIFIMSFISERFMYPLFHAFGSQFFEIGAKELMGWVFNSMLPGLLCFLIGFYCVLHSWMNAFAELLRFADRMFYRDWWNATNFSVYYRTWNVIVHDWLYQYVYRDLYLHVFKKRRGICQFLVFCLSAIFHEYILGFTFRFCYPILFIEFQGAGVLLFFATRKDLKTLGNCFMWMSIAMGMGILLSLYHMEFYARENCDYDKDNWLNYFRPISWSCNGLKFSENWKIQF